MGKRLRRLLTGRLAIATVGLVAVSSLIALRPSRADGPNSDASADTEDTDSEDTPTIDPMSTNATCYVCHIPFVREPISKVHFAAEVTCIKCHGLSADHANDEDIGATRPDITFKRNEIDAACRKCHAEHDAPARAVVARFLERKPAKSPAVCTDCHGHHRIEASREE